jgi:negative regulator of flagellin synthesis FlgM
MVIDKIGNINNIVEPRKTRNVSENKGTARNDSVQISSEGKIAAETARVTQVVQETPDVRADRVAEIKQQIADGTYDFNNERVLEMVADRIANFLLRG